jgi:hypothetical protein
MSVHAASSRRNPHCCSSTATTDKVPAPKKFKRVYERFDGPIPPELVGGVGYEDSERSKDRNDLDHLASKPTHQAGRSFRTRPVVAY